MILHRRRLGSAAATLVVLLLAACTPGPPPDLRPPDPASRPIAATDDATRRIVVLHINDVYRIDGVDGGEHGGLARVRALRTELEKEHPELLVMLAGDFLFPSLLSREFSGEHMVNILNRLDGDPAAFDERLFVTFGNHEFDKEKMADAEMLEGRIAESQFTWLGTDVDFAIGYDGTPVVAGENLVRTHLLDVAGVRVGLLSLTTDVKHPAYVVRFRDPEKTARRASRELRQAGAEVVIGLTHLLAMEDAELLAALGDAGPDVIFGGHEHNKQAHEAGGRYVLKADAEARTATVATIDVDGERPVVDWRWQALGPDSPVDADVARAVDDWLARHDEAYCRDRLARPPGCLAEVLGRTDVALLGEELEIRRFETNLGNYVVDQALATLEPYGAQLAFINAGSLRLNQDIPPGDITLRHVEEIFQYPSQLRLLRIDGRILQQVVDHAVTSWTGTGHWLQVAGFAFRHDPVAGTADGLTLLSANGPRPIEPEEELLVVTSEFLAKPETGQDGYTMLTADRGVDVGATPTVKEVTVAALRAAHTDGIAPRVEGRICNTERDGPCLAIVDD